MKVKELVICGLRFLRSHVSGVRGPDSRTVDPIREPPPTARQLATTHTRLNRDRVASDFLVVVGVLLLVLSISRLRICWANDSHLGHSSGALIGLAVDLHHGVFYRPLFGRDGFGGTRYFPLHFVLHASLMELDPDPFVTGYALTAVSTLGLLIGMYVLLRWLGIDRTTAVGCSLLLLAAGSVQVGLVSVHADLLASALNVWGLLFCLKAINDKRLITAAAVLFALAFAAKATMLSGVAAGVSWLFISGRRRLGFWLLAVTVVAIGGVLTCMYVASDGRVFEIMRRCASAGTTISTLVRAPLRLFLEANRHDPASLSFVVMAASAFIATTWKVRLSLPALFLVTTFGMVSVIFASPGTTSNHLLDLHVACIIMLATWVTPTKVAVRRFTFAALAVAGLIAVPSILDNRRFDIVDVKQSNQAALEVIPAFQGPILAENPALPVFFGQRPYLLDPFMFRVLSLQNPSFAEPLFEGLRKHRFSAVVLEMDPDNAIGRRWYEKTHFGPGFVEALQTNYRAAVQLPGQLIYLPRGQVTIGFPSDGASSQKEQ